MAHRADRRVTHARRWIGALLLAFAGGPAAAESLEDAIPQLYGKEVKTTIGRVAEPLQPRSLSQFESLSAVLRSSVPSLPLPSASGSFRFVFDPRFDTYARRTQSMGPIFAERAQTIGRGKAILDVSVSHAEFDTFEGDDLDRLEFSEPAFAVTAQLPPEDRERVRSERLRTELDLDIATESFLLAAAYGVRDDLDVSLGLTLTNLRFSVTGTTRVQDDSGPVDTSFVASDESRFCTRDGRTDKKCLTNSVEDSKFGTGDVLLRAKWNFAGTELADLAVAGTLTIPTGGADDFLGFHDPTFTPLLIASKSFGRISPHLNLGYAVRSGEDVSQALWVAGVDVRADERFTLAFDALGFHDDRRDGLNDDVVQGAFGFKVNPFGRSVLAASFQVPMNRDGLRADVIYTVQVEQSF